jgi:succinate-semialdehyde dehydrogenase/glutarate-semialdehyde dehydrogenase
VPYRSVNPATGEVLKTFTEHTDQEMMEALATADKAFASWATLPIDGRAKIISHAAQLLLERKSELARLATLEMGKRIAESRGGRTSLWSTRLGRHMNLSYTRSRS